MEPVDSFNSPKVGDARTPSKLEAHILEVEKYIASNTLLRKELINAKEIFQEKTGKFKESNQTYESRINAFLYWFIFDWPCSYVIDRKAPYNIYLDNNPLVKKPDAIVSSQIHTLFEFVKITKKETVLVDLFTGKKVLVPDTETLFGFEKGCYFEARVLKFGGKHYFAPFFLMHPQQAYRAIRKQIKLIRKQQDKWDPFLLHLGHLHYKWVNYSNFEVTNIYKF